MYTVLEQYRLLGRKIHGVHEETPLNYTKLWIKTPISYTYYYSGLAYKQKGESTMWDHRLFTIIKSLILWLIVFIPSTVIGAIAFIVTHNSIFGAILIQLFFVILSMAATKVIFKAWTQSYRF